ncbi:hypothetical protein HNR00_001222 [Methylorubrum rhodinum]|uniref:Uncharacterized protein n=1 Tax=Methylorubrum rhodinum TaxID=29428 RepID=A0A840ZH38_9HYPH|nr:hypothetical protein [Methylorubrum rhodinum]MBB5756524.1 hypothetical protein [Methylorubrum rhodinum]
MDNTTGSLSIWPILFVAVGASVIGWAVAKRKKLDQRSWALGCFFFPPVLIALLIVRRRQRAGDTEAFRERWASLASYDPEIKSAVDRMTALGPEAVEQFRLAYADVQSKESIPFIVADIERRWALGDRFDGSRRWSEQLTELRRQGRITDGEYAGLKGRLDEPSQSRGRWVSWWWTLPALLIAAFVFWPRIPGEFPSCTSHTSRELVRQVVENGPNSKLTNIELLDLHEIEERASDPKVPERYCSGTLTLNSGERFILWRLHQRNNNVFVEVSGL